jgi:hypothetical protein
MTHISSPRISIAAASLLVAAITTSAPAFAAPAGNSRLLSAAVPAQAQTVRWRGHGWRGAAPFVGGLAAGAIVGSALGSNGYSYRGPAYDNYAETYADNYAYGGGYAPNYSDNYVGNYADNYDDNYVGDTGGNAIVACAQRFRSYDPESQTYMGYDGIRHSCP